MRFLSTITSLLTVALAARASPLIAPGEADQSEHTGILASRGIGVMRVPLHLGSLPGNMTFTIDSITMNRPSGFAGYYYTPNRRSVPFTVDSSQVVAAVAKGERGLSLVTFSFTSNGGLGGFGLNSGQGSSALIRFTLRGVPHGAPNTPNLNLQGTITVGSSKWGVFSRPDYTVFSWQIDGHGYNTYSGSTPTLVGLDQSVILIEYNPESRNLGMGITNKVDTITQVMQWFVTGIIAGHVAIWGFVGGKVIVFGGAAIAAVVMVIEEVDDYYRSTGGRPINT